MSKAKQHRRTESQAVKELEHVFKSVDLEGEGKLDMASFQTALYSLDVMVEYEKMEELFNSVDTSKKGYIHYEDLLRLLKEGRLKNKTAQKVMESAKTRPSTRDEMKAAPLPVKMKKDSKMSTTLNRAVIVIKKAAMKKIVREEVVEFLKQKGMNDEDINYAYEMAMEQAMSPDEKLRYLKAQISAKDKQLFDLSDQLGRKKLQILNLRAACLKSAGLLLKHRAEEEKAIAPEEVLSEVHSRMDKLRANLQSLNEKSSQPLINEILNLEKLGACLKTGRSFCAYLLLMSFEADKIKSLRKTQAFLSEWEQ